MSQLGMGVMISMLTGDGGDSGDVVRGSIGKKIKAVTCGDRALSFEFEDGSAIELADQGQSCCEARYMTCDDKLSDFVGAELREVELRDAPDVSTGYDVHEQQFLVVTTSAGSFTVASHNEHNGYYGGFWITARQVKGPDSLSSVHGPDQTAGGTEEV